MVAACLPSGQREQLAAEAAPAAAENVPAGHSAQDERDAEKLPGGHDTGIQARHLPRPHILHNIVTNIIL